MKVIVAALLFVSEQPWSFYIHHKRISFEEEFKRLLAAYGIQEE
jgi:hypothetical protein